MACGALDNDSVLHLDVMMSRIQDMARRLIALKNQKMLSSVTLRNLIPINS